MSYICIPTDGEFITVSNNGVLNVPYNPIIPFIEGDGIGKDITESMLYVVNCAVQKAYGNKKRIVWLEVYVGDKAQKMYGFGEFLPEETLDIMRKALISIKGPLTTPVGGGIRSLNVKIRQLLDLYVCCRPMRYFYGVPTPVKEPWKVNMVVLRENSEDIYSGIEWKANSVGAKKVIDFLCKNMGVRNIRFSNSCGVGIKLVSEEGTKRLIKFAIQYAINNNYGSVTLVHKGNIMKFTEGAFREWGYDVVYKCFNGIPHSNGVWAQLINPKNKMNIIVKDIMADAFFQQILLKPEDYGVIATLNLNGDYISDALAAQIGGIGISPGANMGNNIALFEATHGSAPKYANLNIANPSSLILSAEMLLRHIGWYQAADYIMDGIKKTIKSKFVTSDFYKKMKDAVCLGTMEFSKKIVENM
ncbi:NADP-dependent isocitrate dehydrogenase [Candidatus Legionella polyplacis]|uniref:NADP-dependent isocitrate dehydrogenase n=1 Tax=Candidatus Legionella polyplacis TaxID=2005262 RepID=UPI000C1DE74C|nr:NADP-dependent isocitrate dehydrogenase [Candidatus Legionella polyplacis]ATW02011.1 NADP-dependent isocitrate dehydrogenase [Candidatus Legionella polyplacis]